MLALLIVAPACDDGPVIPPETFQPVGTWQATQFTATTGLGHYDLLELGGFISIQLLENNTFAGTYAVPDFEDHPSDEFSVAGTWTLDGLSTVLMDHDGESYLRRLAFVGGGDQMTASGAVDGVDITIILER
jgi:hypothetical protein